MRARFGVIVASLAIAAAVVAGCTSSNSRNLADKPTARPTFVARTPVPAGLPAATKDPTTVVYYENCAAARNAGVAPLHRNDPGYSSKLDRDGDGVACE